jgi:hypothetical protein
VRAARPWDRELSAERRLPASDRGPVECWALERLIAARSTSRSTGVAVEVEVAAAAAVEVMDVTWNWDTTGAGRVRTKAGGDG